MVAVAKAFATEGGTSNVPAAFDVAETRACLPAGRDSRTYRFMRWKEDLNLRAPCEAHGFRNQPVWPLQHSTITFKSYKRCRIRNEPIRPLWHVSILSLFAFCFLLISFPVPPIRIELISTVPQTVALSVELRGQSFVHSPRKIKFILIVRG